MAQESRDNEARVKAKKEGKDAPKEQPKSEEKEATKESDNEDWKARGTEFIERAELEHVPRHVCESMASFQTSWPVLNFPYKNFDRTSFAAWSSPSQPTSTLTQTVIARTSFVGFGVGDFAAEQKLPAGAPGHAHVVYSQTYDAEEKLKGAIHTHAHTAFSFFVDGFLV